MEACVVKILTGFSQKNAVHRAFSILIQKVNPVLHFSFCLGGFKADITDRAVFLSFKDICHVDIPLKYCCRWNHSRHVVIHIHITDVPNLSTRVKIKTHG